MTTPDTPTQTVPVAELTPGDRVIVPMVGNVEIVTNNEGGLISTDGTGPGSAYMWNPGDEVDIVSRA